jgi:hypothetical protein
MDRHHIQCLKLYAIDYFHCYRHSSQGAELGRTGLRCIRVEGVGDMKKAGAGTLRVRYLQTYL